MKLGVLLWNNLMAVFVFAIIVFAGTVSAQYRLPVDTAQSSLMTRRMPPLSIALKDEPTYRSDTAKVLIPPHKQGFFCRFEDKMQMKWKLPLNLELK